MDKLKYASLRSILMGALREVIDGEISDKDVFFSIIYEREEQLECDTNEGCNIIIRKMKSKLSEDEIYRQCQESTVSDDLDRVFVYCRKIGAIFDKQFTYNIYYIIQMKDLLNIHAIYINCVEQAYCNWLRDFVAENRLGKWKIDDAKCMEACGEIVKKSQGIFEGNMKELFDIDVGIITDISGSYYEGDKCNCSLCFKLEEGNADGVMFFEKDCVSVDRKNIKSIRKRLQMCQEKHILLFEHAAGKKWKATGICHEDGLNNIVFKILDHMYWNMRIGDKHCICYKYGKFIVYQPEYKKKEFEDAFTKTFGIRPNSHCLEWFAKSMEQAHGTIIVIIDEGDDEKGVVNEVERLSKVSTCIRIKNEAPLHEKYIIGVASIDGAVIIDKQGVCHAIGAILDGISEVRGDHAYGARHNSALKYIEAKKNCNISAMAIVFSEDKTIKIITTKDSVKRDDNVR